jgi:hypothetical protein
VSMENLNPLLSEALAGVEIGNPDGCACLSFT